MICWKYKAFNETLTIIEGMITTANDEDSSLANVILDLRNNGLQILELTKATKMEYQQFKILQALKSKVAVKPKKLKTTKLTIRQRFKLFWAAILGRKNV